MCEFDLTIFAILICRPSNARLSSPVRFADRLPGHVQVEALAARELLKERVKHIAVAGGDHGRGIGGLYRVRVTVADHNLSAHRVDDVIEEASLVHPQG